MIIFLLKNNYCYNYTKFKCFFIIINNLQNAAYILICINCILSHIFKFIENNAIVKKKYLIRLKYNLYYDSNLNFFLFFEFFLEK